MAVKCMRGENIRAEKKHSNRKQAGSVGRAKAGALAPNQAQHCLHAPWSSACCHCFPSPYSLCSLGKARARLLSPGPGRPCSFLSGVSPYPSSRPALILGKGLACDFSAEVWTMAQRNFLSEDPCQEERGMGGPSRGPFLLTGVAVTAFRVSVNPITSSFPVAGNGAQVPLNVLGMSQLCPPCASFLFRGGQCFPSSASLKPSGPAGFLGNP